MAKQQQEQPQKQGKKKKDEGVSGAAVKTGASEGLPASRLREVNRILENTAWGSYRTEFYPTYDYKAVGIAAHEKAQ